jgi:hypothetical protein
MWLQKGRIDSVDLIVAISGVAALPRRKSLAFLALVFLHHRQPRERRFFRVAPC